MRTGQAKMPKRGAVRAQLVGRQQFRREALLPEQLAHQPECRVLVAAALHQHIENLALVIDGAPQVHPVAGDANHHLIEVPPVARSWAAPSKPAGGPGAELQTPPPHRFIGNLQASLGQKLLDVAVAQGEPQIKPDRVLDDRRREAMSAIGALIHPGILPCRATRSNPISVTMPPWDIAAIRFGVAGSFLFPYLIAKGLAFERLGSIGLAAIVT